MGHDGHGRMKRIATAPAVFSRVIGRKKISPRLKKVLNYLRTEHQSLLSELKGMSPGHEIGD